MAPRGSGRVGTKWWQAGLVLKIGLRNLAASRAKTLIIGGIVLLGAALVVVGSSLLESVDRGMRASIQGSLGGHLQVYDARSRDELALYGGMMGESQLEPMEDFARVKEVLSAVPNVKQVVPMGIDQALVSIGNQFDVALERLRGDVREWLAGAGAGPATPPAAAPPADPDLARRLEARKAHLRRMIAILSEDLVQARSILDPGARDAAEWLGNQEDLARAATDRFWAEFDADPLAALEFLENRIAPLALDGGFTFLRYVGTDLEAFMRAFDRTEIVEGTRVPPGQRGILLGKWYAEEWLKLRAAHRLDQVERARRTQGRRIDEDEELRRWIREAGGQTREILLQLDPIRAEEAARRLGAALETDERDLPKLLAALFTIDEATFDRRYEIFYDALAPLLQLYSIRVGDTITIKAPAKSGYMNSVNVKVYGFVQFRGLEQSGLAGVMSLMDLVTFRDLYGYLTEEKAAEIRALQAGAGAREVSREEAEAALFGSASGLVSESKAAAIDDERLLSGPSVARHGEALFARVYSQEEIDRGVALNAALLLDDPGELRRTARDVEAAARAAGLDLKVVDWQEASGMVGQSVTLFRIVLYVAVLIVFVVALVIINNAMVMATLQRVKEIGTMRAIGAQRRFVLLMLLVESVTVGIVFGALGTVLGTAIVWLIRARGGIPASNDQLYFFFSGPALLPRLGTTSLAVSLAIVLVVGVLSGLYPALLAMRFTPVEAMAAED